MGRRIMSDTLGKPCTPTIRLDALGKPLHAYNSNGGSSRNQILIYKARDLSRSKSSGYEEVARQHHAHTIVSTASITNPCMQEKKTA